MGGEQLTVSDVLNKLSDRDRSVREAAFHAVGTGFGERIKLFGLITNTLAKDKAISDAWRKLPAPGQFPQPRQHGRGRGGGRAGPTAVASDYGRLAHRYYALKAKWLGLEKLQLWDRNAPLPNDDDSQVPWPEAQRRVLDGVWRVQP